MNRPIQLLPGQLVALRERAVSLVAPNGFDAWTARQVIDAAAQVEAYVLGTAALNDLKALGVKTEVGGDASFRSGAGAWRDQPAKVAVETVGNSLGRAAVDDDAISHDGVSVAGVGAATVGEGEVSGNAASPGGLPA